MPRALRRCPGDNYRCPNLISAGQRYCPDHTTVWAGERTTSSRVTNTAKWKRVRAHVLKRDKHRCQVRGPGCTGKADQVDHIRNTAAGGERYDPANAQAICSHCNAVKAQAERTRRQRQAKRL